jgi:hypothetical protein
MDEELYLNDEPFPVYSHLSWPPKQIRLMRGAVMYGAWHPITLGELEERRDNAVREFESLISRLK